jgi:hypothetical protein
MANFTFCNINYIDNGNGYYYRVGQDGKKVRISKEIYEEALYEYTRDTDEQEEIEQARADAEYEARVAKREEEARAREEADRATEAAMNGAGAKKATKKAEKKVTKKAKKNIAITIKVGDQEIGLTEKQKVFFENLPNDDFFERGEDSTLWTDVYCDTLAGIMNAMIVGAMISTLREKDLIYVGQDKVNGKKCKYFGFTELGKAILKEMGLV